MAMKTCKVDSRSGVVAVAGAVVLGFGLLPAVLGTAAPAGGDWPQWRGPGRDGVSPETGWLAKWPQSGPSQLWKVKIGYGYSSVAVAGGRVYAMGNDGRRDTVWCLDAATGRVVWRKSYPCRKGGYPGPRATPTVDGKVVYTISRQAQVFCFDAATGKVLWSKDLTRELKVRTPTWGFAGSPLVMGKLLVVNVGTAGVALEKTTGRVVWSTGAGKAGYASPVAFKMDGRETVLIFSARALNCLDVRTGKLLWSLPWKTSYDINAADPIVVGNRIFISNGYGPGSCALVKVENGKPSIVWRNKEMKNHFSTCVIYKGYIYGAHGTGHVVLRCLSLDTGEVKWTSPRLRMASLILADGKLIVQADAGRLLVVEATAEAYRPIAQATVLRGQCWTIPVLAGGRIYCRNSGKKTGKGELVCLDVRKR